jgi:ABC-2 type transport system permease protein
VLLGLLFAASVVLLLRVVEPERLMRVESLPDLTGFFAALQSPVTPLLPSYWAGETLFASLFGSYDLVHAGALWMTAAALTVAVGLAYGRWHFAGYSQSQESPASRVFRLLFVDRMAAALPLTPLRRHLIVKDAKVFLRDISQWSQLLLLLALVALYLFNFRALDLERIPTMTGVIRNALAFFNLGLAGFVMSTVAVRFVFPAVSLEGRAFWIVRSAPRR